LLVDARDADAVVADRSEDPSDVCSVAAIHRVVVHWVACRREDVVPVRSSRAAADSAGVRPDVRREVGMRVFDTGVDDADDDRMTALSDVPGRNNAFVRSRNAGGPIHGLTGVLGAPLQAEGGVVRNGCLAHDVVGFGVADAWKTSKDTDGANHRAARNSNEMDACAELPDLLRTDRGFSPASLARRSPLLKTEQDLAVSERRHLRLATRRRRSVDDDTGAEEQGSDRNRNRDHNEKSGPFAGSPGQADPPSPQSLTPQLPAP
jgi:hypothetical protein